MNLAVLSIRILSVTLIADDFAAYKIVIADKKQKWVVFRRYSSILKFHNDLARFAPEALANFYAFQRKSGSAIDNQTTLKSEGPN